MSISAIAERQADTQKLYLRSMETYESHPFATRHKLDAVEDELTALEHEMLDMPPLYRGHKGRLWPRLKGLLAYNVLIDSGELPQVQAMSIAEAGLRGGNGPKGTIPEREWSDIIGDPNRTSPRYYFNFEVDQNGFGSCAGEGAANGGSTRISQDGQQKVCLNGYFNYHHSSGGVDRGSSLSENISVMQKYGCCTVDVRPRSRGWRAKPTQAEYDDAAKYKLQPDGIVRVRNKAELVTLVLKGFPVYFGYPGHAILCVDIVSTSRLLYQNSWGKDWGNNGRGTLAFSSIAWNYGAFAFVSMGDKK